MRHGQKRSQKLGWRVAIGTTFTALGAIVVALGDIGGARSAICETPAFTSSCVKMGLISSDASGGQTRERTLQRLIDLLEAGRISEGAFERQFAALLADAVSASASTSIPQVQESIDAASARASQRRQPDLLLAAAHIASPANRDRGFDTLESVAHSLQDWLDIAALSFWVDPPRAARAYEHALQIAPDNVEGLIQLAYLRIDFGELDAAKSAFQRALDLAEHVSSVQASALNGLALIAIQRAEFDEAAAHLSQAREIAERTGATSALAATLGNMGTVATQRGDAPEAERFLRQAVAQYRSLGDHAGEAINLGNLGNLYRSQHRLDDAEAAYRAALAINQSQGRSEGIAWALSNLGILYTLRGDAERAREHQQRALAMFREIDHLSGEASALVRLAYVAAGRNEYEEAERLANDARRLYQRLEHPMGLAGIADLEGVIAIQKGDSTAACRSWSEAQRIRAAHGTTRSEAALSTSRMMQLARCA